MWGGEAGTSLSPLSLSNNGGLGDCNAGGVAFQASARPAAKVSSTRLLHTRTQGAAPLTLCNPQPFGRQRQHLRKCAEGRRRPVGRGRRIERHEAGLRSSRSPRSRQRRNQGRARTRANGGRDRVRKRALGQTAAASSLPSPTCAWLCSARLQMCSIHTSNSAWRVAFLVSFVRLRPRPAWRAGHIRQGTGAGADKRCRAGQAQGQLERGPTKKPWWWS